MQESTTLVGEVHGTPRNYEEFYYKYRPIVLAITRQFNLSLSFHEQEDLADELVDEFVACDYLNPDAPHAFNRNYIYIDKQGKERKAQFLTFLYHFIRNRIMNFRQKRNRWLGFVSVDDIKDREGYADLARGYELLEAKPEPRAEMDFMEVIDRIHKELEEIAVYKGAKRNLAVLFEMVVYQIKENGEIDKKAIREYFGISRQSVTLWLRDLRYHPAMRYLR